MAYFLFIDESGQDQRDSPYEVLAGVAIKDLNLWGLIREIQSAEIDHFGTRYAKGWGELKAKNLLKAKTYRLAAQMPPLPFEERQSLAKNCLENGATAGRREITALAQAKIDYIRKVFRICISYGCRMFASIILRNERSSHHAEYLRKDYAFLFERFYYYLEDTDPSTAGIVVFDELEKSQSHLLVEQMDRYFKRTQKGQERSLQIIPEPFFVHSDLTTGIQVADFLAYILSWGFRTNRMTKNRREALEDLVTLACSMRYKAVREIDNNPNYEIWSFALISDLLVKENEAI